MKKFTIVCDIDGVLAYFVSGFRDFVSAKFNIPLSNLTLDVSWGFDEWGVSPNSIPDLVREFGESGGYAKLRSIDGGNEAIFYQLENQGFYVHLATARPVSFAEDTQDWLEAHRMGDIPVHYGVERKESIHGDLWIDDSPEACQRLINAGKAVAVFHHRYNEHVCTDNNLSFRIHTLGDIYPIIDKLSLRTKEPIA